MASARVQKEISKLASDPPPGVWCAPKTDSVTKLQAQIQGPQDSVYQGGVFSLIVDVPLRYPFEPPKVNFSTPVYHPNIDRDGRICLDILNMPPKGSWKPSLSIAIVLQSISLLLSEPNGDDGLVTDVTHQYKHQRVLFDKTAKEWTIKYAHSHCKPSEKETEKETEKEESQKEHAESGEPFQAPPPRKKTKLCLANT